MRKNVTPGEAISPIDGRYANKTAELSDIFSEKALMRARILVEVEYLIALSEIAKIIRDLSRDEIDLLQSLYANFSDEDFCIIQDFEKKTNHDVKAVEYFLRDKLKSTGLADLIPFVHIGRTSEDINSVSLAIIVRRGTQLLIKRYYELIDVLTAMGKKYSDLPMLARTHGQPATPTTFGRQMLVFSSRLNKDLEILNTTEIRLGVKWNGATGGNNALYAAYPDVDWRHFAHSFIYEHLEPMFPEDIRFENIVINTQIEPHDGYRRLFSILKGMNTTLIGFTQDIWTYISHEVLLQKPVEGEIGSSAMPQKINPIMFENAEGNLGMANALFEFFCQKLPISRLQRDLSDSTVERNFGVAYAHTLLALKSILAGLKRVYVNEAGLAQELDNHWEVISEAYQVVLRKNKVEDGYELLLERTRGKEITKELLHDFVDEMVAAGKINDTTAAELKKLTPHNYVGKVPFP